MAIRVFVALILTVSIVSVTACRGNTPQSESQPQAGAAPAASSADHGGHAGGRVFFVQPANGATVKSPVTFVFGSDQFTIAPVPPGEVKEVRAGTGHFHLGVDADCLPAGEVIPKAQPWIHFGDGKNTIEMQLTPGMHKFSVQAGDDKHATMTGLCETITVNVAG